MNTLQGKKEHLENDKKGSIGNDPISRKIIVLKPGLNDKSHSFLLAAVLN
jgi:hypothetical protein